jgi:peptidoglycan/LPS O-acetylase OafA/YrhL
MDEGASLALRLDKRGGDRRVGAIRLFLACGVVFGHAERGILHNVGLTADRAWWLSLVGGRAVIFFYIISGFLISYALHEKYPATAAGTLAFFRSRFLRIFPLWWVLLIVCLLINIPPWPTTHPLATLSFATALFGTDWIVAFWAYPLGYQDVFPHALGVGWTLGAELTFYLIAPWVLRSPKTALFLFLLSAMVRLGVAMTLPAKAGTVYIIWSYVFFPATLMFFLLGHFANVIGRSLRPGAAISVAALALAAMFSWLDSPPITVDRLPAYLSCLCFAAALPGVFAATKDGRLFNFLGDLTYPLYLTHTMTMAALFGAWGFAGPFGHFLIAKAALFGSPALDGAFLIAAILCVALLVATLAHFAIERPARRAVAFFLSSWKERMRPMPADT